MSKEGAFGGTYFRDIYSCVNGKVYKDSWKEFKELKDIDKKYYLGKRSKDDKRQIKKIEKIVYRFKDADSKFDDYNISPKIRQVLLHWGYELKESNIK